MLKKGKNMSESKYTRTLTTTVDSFTYQGFFLRKTIHFQIFLQPL